MKCNQLMEKEMKRADWRELSLPDDLQSWINGGFVEDDGCIFLRSLYKNYQGLDKFPDRTGVECFVNSFHIDDYVSERYLDYSFLFCEQLLACWKKYNQAQKLNVIISHDEFGAVVKFHLKRQDENWLSSNLEGYEEAVLETSEPI